MARDEDCEDRQNCWWHIDHPNAPLMERPEDLCDCRPKKTKKPEDLNVWYVLMGVIGLALVALTAWWFK